MAKTIKLRASVGRQRMDPSIMRHEARYIASLRAQFKVITDNYERIVQAMKGKPSAEILLEALQPTFRLSQKYVPVLSGDLKASGFLEIDPSSKLPRVVIGYARGGSPHYAAHVHERVDIGHAPPTRSKFLLAALEEDNANIQKRIVRGYKQMLGVNA